MSALTLGAVLFVLWGVSLQLKDSSIIDIAWGPAFVLVAWLSLVDAPHAYVVASLVTVWGLRLGLYLFWRNRGRGEDKRYAAMRKKHGPSWWWKSAFIVFGLQGVLVMIVSLPVQAAVTRPMAPWGYAGAGLVFIGVAFESLGDWQLARFKADPDNKGKIMTSGLWSWTRHPNYFGDFVTWWGFGVFGLATGAWWTVLGPLVMSVLLIRVSGKDLLEQDMMQRPGYAEYARVTSGFFPRPPRR
ncbi:MAG: hypothetical protein DI536_26775 [Archangium gephyra]|uniref:Uncharacterized protein n=1 Tax=Archangium gephyra TaxID=48 RepID=A0A2W5T8A4_9BACT|nr:MAG: hypothetical protein DI536_26775 [Archangium gephyra]